MSSPLDSGAVKTRRVDPDGAADVEIDVAISTKVAAPHNWESEQRMETRSEANSKSEQQNVEANSHECVGVYVNNETLSIKGRAKNMSSPLDSGAVKTRRVEAGGEVEDLTTDVSDSDPTDGPTNVLHKDKSK
jgi:hypothetical protein